MRCYQVGLIQIARVDVVGGGGATGSGASWCFDNGRRRQAAEIGAGCPTDLLAGIAESMRVEINAHAKIVLNGVAGRLC